MATVLIVEDNVTNMKLSTFLLESVDHTVLAAVNAEAGLAMARETLPDLILMDIQLPGMDGLQATAVLKGDPATRDIPVIALTALAMKGDEERILAAGCDGYIAKPLDYKEFLRRVAEVVGSAGSSSAAVAEPAPPPDSPTTPGHAHELRRSTD